MVRTDLWCQVKWDPENVGELLARSADTQPQGEIRGASSISGVSGHFAKIKYFVLALLEISKNNTQLAVSQSSHMLQPWNYTEQMLWLCDSNPTFPPIPGLRQWLAENHWMGGNMLSSFATARAILLSCCPQMEWPTFKKPRSQTEVSKEAAGWYFLYFVWRQREPCRGNQKPRFPHGQRFQSPPVSLEQIAFCLWILVYLSLTFWLGSIYDCCTQVPGAGRALGSSDSLNLWVLD